jgi:hypothetical protein
MPSSTPPPRRGLWVIVTCMGRLEFLRQTLPTVLANVDATYCLVDYSCPERAGDWVRRAHPDECRSGRIVVISVSDQRAFHKAAALNAGARAALAGGAEYLCFLDADSVAGPDLGRFLEAQLAPARFLVELRSASLFGFLGVPAEAFARLGGFDERIVGYGGEDIEMRLRLRLVLGLESAELPLGHVFALPHSGELRTRHYTESDPAVSNQRNLDYVLTQVRAWTGRDLLEHDPSVVNLYRGPGLAPPPTARRGRPGTGRGRSRS